MNKFEETLAKEAVKAVLRQSADNIYGNTSLLTYKRLVPVSCSKRKSKGLRMEIEIEINEFT